VPVLVVAAIATEAIAIGTFLLLERPCTRAIVSFAKRRLIQATMIVPAPAQ
jgi:hypothetical protein